MPEIELTAGTVEYEDTGGPGPPLVLLHGVLMDGTLWRKVVADLRTDHRCVVPTLPLGGHPRPMRDDADLSPGGHGRIVAELIERLDLRDVTLVGNDTGGAVAQVMLLTERPERVTRLVLTSCEAFDNYPPGLPGKVSAISGVMPGGLFFAAQSLRIPPLRRLPFTFGWMAKRPIPGEIMNRWMRPVRTQAAIRRDFKKFLHGLDLQEMLRATEQLASFEGPALVAWAAEDRVMPPEHGRRMADLLPNGRYVEIADSYTLIPEDQPRELARLIRGFVAEHADNPGRPARQPA